MDENYPVVTRGSGTLTITQHRDHPLAFPPGTYFSVRRVIATALGEQIDLTTRQGWQTANRLASTATTASGQIAGAMLGPPTIAQLVGIPGKATAVFELPTGLFYVTATEKLTEQIPPFLVTIPMTNPSGDGWLYDVQVFPKTLETAQGPPAGSENLLPEYNVAPANMEPGNAAPGIAAVIAPQQAPVLAELPLTGSSALLVGVAITLVAMGSAAFRKAGRPPATKQNNAPV